jgi:hypothetical protein
MRKSIEEELARAEKVHVTACGRVTVGVTGNVVVALGEGVTEDDLFDMAEEVAECCSDWEDADGRPEDPGYVHGHELDSDIGDAHDGEPAQCLIYRDEEGNISFKKLEG